MLSKLSWIGCIPILFIVMATGGIAKEYIIFTIAQEVSTGNPNENPKKNFYLNIGKNQGVEVGTLLDVYRIISKLDPYNNNQRYNYKVKVGELKVLHTEANAAIAHTNRISSDNAIPLFEIKDFMIGDQVGVHIEN